MFKNPKSFITQCGREITDQELDLILETVEMFPKLSQTDLAETICEHLGWHTASGRYKREACLKLLKKLEAGGALELPEKRGYSVPNRPGIVLTARTAPSCSATESSLGELEPISLEVAAGKETTKLFNEYLYRYHYLRYKQPFGCYLGSCYKAAGWEYLGMTTGEGLVRKGKSYRTTPKKIFVKPLVDNFRQLLCSKGLIGRREL